MLEVLPVNQPELRRMQGPITSAERGRPKLCLVTLPTDLGCLAIEHHMLSVIRRFADVEHFSFAATQKDFRSEPIQGLRMRIARLSEMAALNRHLYRCRQQSIPILIFSMGAALHALPFAKAYPGTFSVLLDWTRTLRLDFENRDLNALQHMILPLHRAALANAYRVLCPTEICKRHLHDRYKVPGSKLTKALMPVNIERFSPAVWPLTRRPGRPRVLFVGGDLKRKGADLLIGWYHATGHELCDLTVVTYAAPAERLSAAIAWKRGVEFGSDQHLDIFRNHDILCLPTRFDPFGMVMAEAAACGMAVVTDEQALGHAEIMRDGQSGLVGKTPEDCIRLLQSLVVDPSRIHEMRVAARELMLERYAPHKVFQNLASALPLLENADGHAWSRETAGRANFCPPT